jgi:Family of unknown function (DUF5706)
MSRGERSSDFQASRDYAWRRLDLVLHGVSHAEVKASATLAATAFIAVASVQVISSASDNWTRWFGWAGAVATLAAALSFLMALVPRTKAVPARKSHIYFGDIMSGYSEKKDCESFSRQFVSEVQDPLSEIRELGAQVWRNAHVAMAKYRAIAVGVVLLCAACFFLAVAVSLLTAHQA